MLLKIGEISSSKDIEKYETLQVKQNEFTATILWCGWIHESCYVNLINRHWFKIGTLIDHLQLCYEYLLGFNKWLEVIATQNKRRMVIAYGVSISQNGNNWITDCKQLG